MFLNLVRFFLAMFFSFRYLSNHMLKQMFIYSGNAPHFLVYFFFTCQLVFLCNGWRFSIGLTLIPMENSICCIVFALVIHILVYFSQFLRYRFFCEFRFPSASPLCLSMSRIRALLFFRSVVPINILNDIGRPWENRRNKTFI